MSSILIKNGTCYIDGVWKRTNLLVVDEKIQYIGLEAKEANQIFDASDYKIIPGLIDPHVHFSLDCGTITSVDDFDSGTISAACGGVTTIIDFLDPTRNARKLEKSYYERLALASSSHVDFHLHACIKEPDADLEAYVQQMKLLGINSIKLFTTYSETRRRTYDKDIIKLLTLSKKYKFIVCCHIENDELIKIKPEDKCTDVADRRNSESEITETLKLAEFVRATNGYLYMVHLSSGETLKRLKEEYSDILNKNFFVESCPQYFYFDKEILHKNNGCLYTFAPPLRSKFEQETLKENIDFVDTIGTDHCAFNKEDKLSHPSLIGHPLGVGGIETSFILLHKLFGDKIIDKMSKNTAKIEGFSQKGSISIGKDADLVFLKNVAPYKIGKPHGKANYSIYEGIEVDEKIIHTMLRGNFILKDEKFIGGKGELINCDKEVTL